MSARRLLPAQLTAIGRHNARDLVLSYAMTCFETVCDTFYPAIIGMAIDGLLHDNVWRLVPLLVVWTAHLAVGLIRHVFDTTVFTRIYSDLAGEMVSRQRAQGTSEPVVVARVVLAREIIGFLQTDIPGLTVAIVRLTGAMALLAVYGRWLGVGAVSAAALIAVINARFAGTAQRLNAALNNRLEHEVEIVGSAPVPLVRRHFRRVSFWRVRISNAEAFTWGAVELVVIGLTLFVLLRLTALPHPTPGAIYAVLSYVWMFYDGVNTLPDVVQRAARLHDIGGRLAEDVDAIG